MTIPTTYSSPPATPAATAQLANLEPAIALLASGHYLVTRPGAETVTAGVVTVAAPVYFWTKGSLQPTDEKDIELLPEGLRERESKVLYTEHVLQAVGATSGADAVTVAGVLYEVQSVEDWQQLGAYHRAVLLKVGS